MHIFLLCDENSDVDGPLCLHSACQPLIGTSILMLPPTKVNECLLRVPAYIEFSSILYVSQRGRLLVNVILVKTAFIRVDVSHLAVDTTKIDDVDYVYLYWID